MNDKIRICIVGAGRAGMIHVKNYVTQIRNAEVTAVVDPVPRLAELMCKEFEIGKSYLDYKSALEDKNIDAIVITSPTVFHKDLVVDFANAGKHIFCEKPMAMNENECDEMVDVCKKNGLLLQIGFMRRFDENFIRAKEIVDSGEIGNVVLVRSNTRGPNIPKPWMFDLEKSNGPLAEVNSHDIDMMRWFTESEFKTVYAIGGNFRSSEALVQYPEFYDNIVMNVRFKNGMQGLLDGAQGVEYGYDARTEILGEKGVIFIGQVHDNTVISCSKKNNVVRPVMKSWGNLFKEAYHSEDEHFVDCIINDKEPKVTGYDGKKAVQVVKAGNTSIKEKRIVEIEG